MASLDDDLAALATMSPAQLRLEWKKHYKASAPDLTPDLLARGIAHLLQERAQGGLPPAIRRELDQLMRSGPRDGNAQSTTRIKAGTRLGRDWGGRTHHVLIVDEGFLYNNQRYASLTAIAREITGARWSGPRFFGLKQKRVGTA
jgi:hypothetical protein